MPAETSISRPMSRFLALAATLAVVLAMIPLAHTGRAQQTGAKTKLEANSNPEAAVSYSQFTFADGAQEALLGREDLFADLLSSGVAQGVLEAPLLLTTSDQLSEVTAQELERLGAERVTILGGPAAVSADVEQNLRDRGYETRRIAGPTRLETAIAIARTLVPGATTALLARAYAPETDPTQAFADSLAAGGWAAAAQFPLLLTESDELSDATEEYLRGSGINKVFVIGGAGAVSERVVLELRAMGKEVERVAGETRAGTAVAIARARGFESSADAEDVVLTEGYDRNAFAAGFPASAFAAFAPAPIVLSNDTSLPPETEEFLTGEGTTDLVCGPYTTDEACEQAADELGHGAVVSPSPSVSPSPTRSPTCVPLPLPLVGCPSPSPSPSPSP